MFVQGFYTSQKPIMSPMSSCGGSMGAAMAGNLRPKPASGLALPAAITGASFFSVSWRRSSSALRGIGGELSVRFRQPVPGRAFWPGETVAGGTGERERWASGPWVARKKGNCRASPHVRRCSGSQFRRSSITSVQAPTLAQSRPEGPLRIEAGPRRRRPSASTWSRREGYRGHLAMCAAQWYFFGLISGVPTVLKTRVSWSVLKLRCRRCSQLHVAVGSPGKATPPTIISRMMHPTAQLSIWLVYRSVPRRSSGGRYHKVTSSRSTCTSCPLRSAMARPKSQILGRPCASMRMLLDLRSWWTMPWSCRWATPAISPPEMLWQMSRGSCFLEAFTSWKRSQQAISTTAIF
mmetsp:Transcript_26824/g.53905  ORF Transcript_26824/g.53905 Transcript_26824/m.53905 type:complete len:350 (+) Transcript_26824:42-1091(+)